MSRTSLFTALLATFTAGLVLAACDPMTPVVPLPGVPDALSGTDTPGATSYACETLQSQEVCSMTSTCMWSTNSGECVRSPYKADKSTR